MGSRTQRARRGIAPTSHPITTSPIATGASNVSIPEVTDADMAFGKIDHLPPYDGIPDDFKRSGHPCSKFISNWFFSGLKQEDLNRLTERDGVDGKKALRAISAIMRSWAPQHEHKEAGCAYLLDQWFTLAPERVR